MFNGETGENIMKLKETSNILTEQHNSYMYLILPVQLSQRVITSQFWEKLKNNLNWSRTFQGILFLYSGTTT